MRRWRADEVRPQGVHAGAHAAADDRRRRLRQAKEMKDLRLTDDMIDCLIITRISDLWDPVNIYMHKKMLKSRNTDEIRVV